MKEQPLNISVRELIEQNAIKNVLSAQERIARSGNAAEVIKITDYALKLSKKSANVLVKVVPEKD